MNPRAAIRSKNFLKNFCGGGDMVGRFPRKPNILWEVAKTAWESRFPRKKIQKNCEKHLIFYVT